MSTRLMLQPSFSNRRQPLLKSKSCSASTHIGEVVGGTAAVCCCCPFGLANFFVLAVYKLPAGLCRRALRRRRREHLLRNGLMPPKRHRCNCGCDETEFQFHSMCMDDSMIDLKSLSSPESEKEVEELEKEMWEKFYSAGFWRSQSQRLKDCSEKMIISNKFQVQAWER